MLTPEQLEARKQYLGASEVAAVMGVDPYASAGDVWLVKTGEAEPFEGNEATERGDLLEPALKEFARREIGDFRHDVMKIYGFHCANFDGIAKDDSFVVEAKSSRVPGEYGDAGTDEVPDKVVIQTHAQMLVAGPKCRIAYIPVITMGLEFRMYVVNRNDTLCDEVEAAGSEFMRDFVRRGIRPSDFRPSMEVLKRVRRQPNTIINVSKLLIDDWIVAKAAEKQAKEDSEEMYRRLVTALDTADACQDETGRVLTYFETHNGGYTKTVKPFSYRTLRIRKNVERIETTQRAAIAAKE